MNRRVCVVIPVYNHGRGAKVLIEKIAPYGLSVILVNDGSTDDTAALLEELAHVHTGIGVVDHGQNQGKGAAVMTGLRTAFADGYTHALQIDADGQHNTDDIPAFLDLSSQNPSAVIAGRPEFDSTIPKSRLLARYLTHVWIWIETLSFTIRDSMCGFRVYPIAPVIRILDSARLGKRMDFDPEILVRLHWSGVRILSVPTRVTYPTDGSSHFRVWLDNWLITRMHIRLVFRMIWQLLSLQTRHFGGRDLPKDTRE